MSSKSMVLLYNISEKSIRQKLFVYKSKVGLEGKKIAVSAMKQSLKAFMPIINQPTPLAEVIDTPFEGQRFIAYCDGEHRTPLHDIYKPGSNALILIGPEGDFSQQEISHALATGFLPVTLGQYRLRTETAALAATAYFNLMV